MSAGRQLLSTRCMHGTCCQAHVVATTLAIVTVVIGTCKPQCHRALLNNLVADSYAWLKGRCARTGLTGWDCHRTSPASVCLATVVAIPMTVLLLAIVSAESLAEEVNGSEMQETCEPLKHESNDIKTEICEWFAIVHS